jgi:hypothetical protein
MSANTEITDGFVVTLELPAVAALDTSTVVGTNLHRDARLLKAEIVPRAAVTANGTNFATITVQNKGTLGSGTTAMASRTWSATNSVAGTKELMTLNGTAANLEVKAGDVVQVVHTSAASGLALPAIAVLLTFLAR